MKKPFQLFPIIVFLLLISAQAAVTITGDTDPYTVDFSYVGNTSDGTLVIDGDSTVSAHLCQIACNPGVTGTATVTGGGSWLLELPYAETPRLSVGEAGAGELNILDGGYVKSSLGSIGYQAGSTGVANVSGSGSLWDVDQLLVGHAGFGELNIDNAGKVVNRNIHIGNSSDSDGIVNVSGNDSKLSVDKFFYVGDINNGQLNVSDGGAVEGGLFVEIGVWAGSHGTVTLTDAGSTWTNSDLLSVGAEGTGELTIQNGAVVESNRAYLGEETGSDGTATIQGSGSAWNCNELYVGAKSTGELNIVDSATMSITGQTRIGYYTDGVGTIHFDAGTLSTGGITYSSPDQLTGIGTIHANGLVTYVDQIFDAAHGTARTITHNTLPGQSITIHLDQTAAGDLGVGYGADSTLTIRDGVQIESCNGSLGWSAGVTGIANISGTGSTWTNAEYLNVGGFGKGILNITGGGTVSTNSCSIRQQAELPSVVRVSGVGSTFTVSDYFRVGNGGNGEMKILSGGVVASDSCYIGCYPNGGRQPTGKVTVSGVGSTWTNTNELRVGYESSVGELNILEGGVVTNHDAYIADSTRYYDSSGVVNVFGGGSTWITNGDLTFSTYDYGELNIADGGLVQIAGKLKMPYFITEVSRINMSTGGMLALAGEADDSLQSFYSLIRGYKAIYWWNDSADEWSLLSTANPSTVYTLDYFSDGDLAGYTILTVLTEGPPDPILGDANCDNRVDTSDATILANNWQAGPGATWLMGDFNGDGYVNASDATILAGNWQAGTGATTSVPEPSTIILILSAMIGFVLLRQKK